MYVVISVAVVCARCGSYGAFEVGKRPLITLLVNIDTQLCYTRCLCPCLGQPASCGPMEKTGSYARSVSTIPSRDQTSNPTFPTLSASLRSVSSNPSLYLTRCVITNRVNYWSNCHMLTDTEPYDMAFLI